ncbi:MAG: efflux RND transporter permease subunit, partial [Flavobacteriales bacterium]
MPYVVEVASPTRFKDVIIDPLTGRPFDKDLLRWSKPELLSKDSATVFRHGEMVGTFFSEDGKSLAIQVKHKEFLSKRGCDSLAVNSQKLVDSFGFSETHLVGRSIGQAYYVDMMQRELVVFISISILLIILFLFIAFRSWWGIWVPVTVVLLSVVWILGIMKLCGKDIDLMLMVLPTIIFVVGMSDVVHVLTKYFDELRSGKEKIEAIKIAFKEIGMATFLTSLTTAVGFLTLLTSSIIPIKEFGIYTAVGVFVAFILAYSLLPAVLVLSRKPNLDNNDDRKSNFWAQQMRRWFVFTMKNRKSLLGAFGLLLVFSLIGLSKVQVNNFILEDLKDSDFLKQEFVFFEEEFSGARPFEMAIMLKHDSLDVFDREVLLELDKLDNFLVETYGVGALVSPSRIIKLSNRTIKGSDRFNVIPKKQKDIDKLVKMINRQDDGKLLSLFINEEKGISRMNGKVSDLGAQEFKHLNAQLENFIQTEINNEYFTLRQTGTARLIDLNNAYLAKDMTVGLLIAFFLIALIVGLMFKDLKMVLICLIPNFFPLILIAGIMGFAGIYLKVSTSIIFTIAFGIAVDDTIHFMSKLRLQL